MSSVFINYSGSTEPKAKKTVFVTATLWFVANPAQLDKGLRFLENEIPPARGLGGIYNVMLGPHGRLASRESMIR